MSTDKPNLFDMFKEDLRKAEMKGRQKEAQAACWYGVADARCSECGLEKRVEPDYDEPCSNDGCDGRITSPAVLEGYL